jgi:hypothetical protein
MNRTAIERQSMKWSAGWLADKWRKEVRNLKHIKVPDPFNDPLIRVLEFVTLSIDSVRGRSFIPLRILRRRLDVSFDNLGGFDLGARWFDCLEGDGEFPIVAEVV